jgi:hypothetical protein
MRKRRLLLSTLAVMVMVSACSGRPLIPSSVTSTSARPARPWHAPPRFPVLGVDLYARVNYPTAVVRRNGKRALYYIRHTLGASSVGIAWNYYVTDIHSNTVQTTKNTLTARNVRLLTKLAEAENLSVVYRPLVEVTTGLGKNGIINPSNWEGSIAPQDQAQWFDSYYNAELPYLAIAQAMHVKEFITGSELMFLNSSNQWPSFLSRVRKAYHGVVSYAAEQRNYFPGFGAQHLLPVYSYGLDAYPRIFLPPTATVPQLVAKWDALFNEMPRQVLYRTALDEVGIRATVGAYYHPSLWGIGGTFNETVQARWFTAACQVVEQYHMRGIYFWNVNLGDNPARPPFPSPPTFEGKPGAMSIPGCLAIFHEARPRTGNPRWAGHPHRPRTLHRRPRRR